MYIRKIIYDNFYTSTKTICGTKNASIITLQLNSQIFKNQYQKNKKIYIY